MTSLSEFLQDESGATSIEYAMIAGGIALVIIGAVNALGITTNGMFTSVASAFS